MEVEAGNENMKFETGPFSNYGVMALTAPTLGEASEKLQHIAHVKTGFITKLPTASKSCFKMGFYRQVQTRNISLPAFLKISRDTYISILLKNGGHFDIYLNIISYI